MYSGHPSNSKFIQYFERRKQEAVSCNNLSLAKGFSLIVCSIRKYPVPILTKLQAESLLGVGPTHVLEFESMLGRPEEQIDFRQWIHSVKQQIEQRIEEVGGFPTSGNANTAVGDGAPCKKLKASEKPYTPPIGSSSWAVVLALHLHCGDGVEGLCAQDVFSKVSVFASKYPKTSKVNETVLKKLVDAEIIGKVTMKGSGQPQGLFGASVSVYYTLTAYGKEMGATLWQRSMRTENLSSLLGLDAYVQKKAVKSTFELIMVVDYREAALTNILHMLNPGILLESRNLTVSDVLWVWRRNKSDEYIAGFAIERKTLEDLSMSIKDGRYEEQRKRLAKAPGINNVIYVIEGKYSNLSMGMLPEASLNTAMRHTDLMAGFGVMRTDNVEETAKLLIDLHVRIQSLGLVDCEDDDEDVVTFRDFNSDTHKTNTLTIAQQSAKMLRAIPGIGSEAILALDEYLRLIGKGGITLSNVAEICVDPNLNETIKSMLGSKRLPINSTALALLREQYFCRS